VNIGGTLIAGPAKKGLQGELTIPGDKSMSHRAVMLASLAEGSTHITGFLPGEDNLATARMFEQMGVRIEWHNPEKTALTVHGVGLHGLQPPLDVLDAGNSGTCARLMLGILAGQSFPSTLTGDASLQKRPMKRVVDPLISMGASIQESHGDNLLPLTINGSRLHGVAYQSKIASAQVKSCIMLAGLFADSETRVQEPRPTRDHTELMLPLFGQNVWVDDEKVIRLQPSGTLTAPHESIDIPADPSSAMFFAVAASLVDGSNITLRNIGRNPRRDGGFRILSRMQANITLQNQCMLGKESIADMQVSGCALQGVHVDSTLVADAIDEFPVLFAAASLCEGSFTLTEAEELRVKESDRIAVMAGALKKAGACIEEFPDGAVIHGGKLRGDCEVDARGDHRIAMAMVVAAQGADKPIVIQNAAAIATSFPDFVPLAQQLGMNVFWQDRP